MTKIKSGMDLLHNFFSSEVSYFYNNFSDFDENKKISIVLAAESLYDTILSLDISEKQRDVIVKQGKSVTDGLNGSVVLGNNIELDGVYALFSIRAFEYDDGMTISGTINHEYTHANDFIDFSKYLRITDSDTLIDSDYWYPMQMWSEFHARRNGYYRVLDINTGGTWTFPDGYDKDIVSIVRDNWVNNREDNELYELMQVCGRYSLLEELFPDTINDFDRDILQGICFGIKRYACNCIYNFCNNHRSFETFIKDISTFHSLIN